MTKPRLILASASPRRRELLAECGVAFTVKPADVDETVLPGEMPAAYVARVAADKALAIHREYPDHFVLGCDTTVVLDARILGKPASDAEAGAMLR
ncbi:MAG: Maf family protein, partial [Wenzhouxiangella sp.]